MPWQWTPVRGMVSCERFLEGGEKGGVFAGKSDGGGGFDIRGKRESGEGWLRMRCFLPGQRTKGLYVYIQNVNGVWLGLPHGVGLWVD